MTNLNYKGFDLPEREVIALMELEELIGKPPKIEVKGNKVIKLDISNNKLKELPESIGNLRFLIELNINDNYLHKFARSMFNFDFLIPLEFEKSSNFPLLFDYFPKKYGAKLFRTSHDDFNNRELQKILMSKIGNNVYLYWDYITDIIKIDPEDSKNEKASWTFELYTKDKKGKRMRINPLKRLNSTTIKHPSKQDFIQLQIVFLCRNYLKFSYLFPLIRSITITIETDKGHSIPAKFLDFYFKINQRTQAIEFQCTSFCNLDLSKYGASTEINFADIEIKFKDEWADPRNERYTQKIFKDFKKRFEKPTFSHLILHLGGLLGKWIDYIAIAFTIGVLPSIFQFLYKTVVAFFSGAFNFFSMDLDQIIIPAFVEILSYLPVLILFFYLTYKFLSKPRSKNLMNY